MTVSLASGPTAHLASRLVRLVGAALLAGLFVAPGSALAQSETDLPDDIFGDEPEGDTEDDTEGAPDPLGDDPLGDDPMGDDPMGDDPMTRERSVAEERADLLAEADEPAVELPPPTKRVIQTLQQKNFMKIGRYELAPHIGFVTNDPFINRYLVGASFAYHVTEIFALEVSGTFSPDLQELDWKPITQQIIENNQVTPDISKIQYYANLNFQYSPIYGKVAVGSSRIIIFDIFGVFGTGLAGTKDDLTALGQDPPEPIAVNTANQLHPTINMGGGLRVIFSEGFALRFEGRGVSYIEVLESKTLEMKNNFTLLAAASIFFPGMNR